MSCWVVPAVAAEFWGVTVDAVWSRIYGDLVPYKIEGGFTFVDVDPWTPTAKGVRPHQPPSTFVPAVDASRSSDDDAAFFEFDLASDSEDDLPPLDNSIEGEEFPPDDLEDADLPDLDEEETATFGRLSWQDVRQQVSRTRRPPTAAA